MNEMILRILNVTTYSKRDFQESCSNWLDFSTQEWGVTFFGSLREEVSLLFGLKITAEIRCQTEGVAFPAFLRGRERCDRVCLIERRKEMVPLS